MTTGFAGEVGDDGYAAEPRLRARMGVPRHTKPFPSQLADQSTGNRRSRNSHNKGDRQDRCQPAA